MMNREQRRAAGRAEKRNKGAVDLKARPEALPVVAVGYCWNEARGVSGFWHQSMLKMISGLGGKVRFREIPVESGPRLDNARSVIVDSFLRNEDDFLLMVDTDMVFDPTDVEMLLGADAPVAGALYFNAATGESPSSTALVQEDNSGESYIPWVPPEMPALPSGSPTPETHEDGTETAEEASSRYAAALGEYFAALESDEYKPQVVAAVGMGLTLIRREVLVAVKEFHQRVFEFEGDRGEDLVFCLRAAEAGFETKVVPLAHVGHIKQVVI